MLWAGLALLAVALGVGYLVVVAGAFEVDPDPDPELDHESGGSSPGENRPASPVTASATASPRCPAARR